MQEAGMNVVNPMTGSRIEIVEISDLEARLRYTSPRTGVHEFSEHVHLSWDEEFKILGGTGAYQVDRKKHTASAGETVVLPHGHRHVHPTNCGDGDLVMEQTVRVLNGDTTAIPKTLGVLFTLFDWHGQGKIGRNAMGYPKNPLKFAAMGKVLGDAGGFDGMMPVALQKMAGATVGRLALAAGVKVIDPKWA